MYIIRIAVMTSTYSNRPFAAYLNLKMFPLAWTILNNSTF